LPVLKSRDFQRPFFCVLHLTWIKALSSSVCATWCIKMKSAFQLNWMKRLMIFDVVWVGSQVTRFPKIINDIITWNYTWKEKFWFFILKRKTFNTLFEEWGEAMRNDKKICRFVNELLGKNWKQKKLPNEKKPHAKNIE
jgi:hypothetical protein